MKAVFDINGKQVQAGKGEIIEVPNLTGEVGDKLKYENVLSIIDGEKITLGQPFIKNASVECKLLEVKQSKKQRVMKYKAKVNYHVVSGHRHSLAVLQVESIKKGS